MLSHSLITIYTEVKVLRLLFHYFTQNLTFEKANTIL